MGEFGATLIADGDTVLTHCNAGALATAGYGTALGVIRAAIESDEKEIEGRRAGASLRTPNRPRRCAGFARELLHFEQDLALDELDDADDSKYHGDDPEKCSSHWVLLSLPRCVPRGRSPQTTTRTDQASPAAFRSRRRA